MGTDFERDDKMMKNDDENVDYYMRWRLKLEGETENMGVCTKERKGVTAPVLMATPKMIFFAEKYISRKKDSFRPKSTCLSLTAGPRILCRQSLCHGREAGGPVGLPDENVNRDGPALLQCHQRWFRHVVCGTATRAEGASGTVRSDRCKW